MRRQVEAAGYDVVEANEETDVADLFTRERIDLVITDVVMGSRGGIHIARDVRAADPGVPVIFVTGAISLESGAIPDIAHELGIQAVLTKPYEAEELLAAIASAFESSPDGL